MKPFNRDFTSLFAAFITTSLIVFPAQAEAGMLSTSSIFTDHMVLQRTTLVPVWGRGVPGRTVTVRGSWNRSARSNVGADSTWMAHVTTPGAGGPYVLSVTDGHDTLRLSDVLIGEVWLCSGQSNMEMPLSGWPPADTILGGAGTIRRADLPALRIFSVKRAISPSPEAACTGAWSVSSPATVSTVSATAFYFGRKLMAELKIPVGLIVSSWGGTVVDAWTGADFLSRLPGYDTTLAKVAGATEDVRKFKEWLTTFPHFNVDNKNEAERWLHLQFDDSLVSARIYPDSDWRTMTLPVLWEQTEVGDFDGVIWFRKSVAIPAAWVHQELQLDLGPIDDMDVTYANGIRVGGYENGSAWNLDRHYTIPAALVDSTILQLAVRVLDNQGGGGIYGHPGSLMLHPSGSAERMDISGSWRYMPVAYLAGNTFTVFGPTGGTYFQHPEIKVNYGPNLPTVLYNGMIAPLVPYSLAGVIWYQGESDIVRASRYKSLFSLMIENWRHAFQRPTLPFYYTQIAPYDYGHVDESAYLREAQLQALSVPNTGMAVTMDIGNPKNIHPANKRDVGERLARWALAKTYRKKLPYSGPVYAGSKVRGDQVEIRFDHAEGGLVLVGGMHGNNIQIAGDDRVFRMAEVRVKGSTLLVSHPEVARPVAVRYGWSDTPDATLFNTDGLPASSFRTDTWNQGRSN